MYAAMKQHQKPSATLTDKDSLRRDQYAGTGKLDARVLVHRLFSTNPEPWQGWVMDRLSPQPGEAVLEVGCGPGALWREAADKVPDVFAPVLADLSLGMVVSARNGCFEKGVPARCLAADAALLPFAPATFDAVVANHMLYHVEDLDAALGAFCRVLRPGGRFLAATNGPGHLRELHELATRVDPSYAAAGAVRRFDLETAPPLLGSHFEDVTLHRYEDGLRITETEPVVAYLKSMWHGARLGGEALDRCRDLLGEALRRDGVFTVTKETGLFVCRGPRGRAEGASA
jgi:ubiquinone/menaquinone biosynthesis C-methylase UbiE